MLPVLLGGGFVTVVIGERRFSSFLVSFFPWLFVDFIVHLETYCWYWRMEILFFLTFLVFVFHLSTLLFILRQPLRSIPAWLNPRKVLPNAVSNTSVFELHFRVLDMHPVGIRGAFLSLHLGGHFSHSQIYDSIFYDTGYTEFSWRKTWQVSAAHNGSESLRASRSLRKAAKTRQKHAYKLF